MNKLLFIANIESEREAIHCKVLLGMLVTMGYIVDLCLIKDKQHIDMSEYQRVSFSKICCFSYDIGISFNYTRFKIIRNICKNCPVLWVDTAENENRLMSGLRWISYIDQILFTTNIKQSKLFNFFARLGIDDSLKLLPKLCVKNQILQDRKPCILVAIETNDIILSPIFSILPILNKLLYYSFSLVMNEVIKPFTNTNIHFIQKDQIGLIQDYDLVIANKDIAIKSALEGVSCIIVGERGYGGIMRDNNIESLYNNNFNGRDGGYFGEPIPPSLLVRDIVSILKAKDDNSCNYLISARLTDIYTRDMCTVKRYLDPQLHLNYLSEQSKILSSILKICDFFSIVQVNNDQWNIIDQFSKKHYSLGKEEYLIVSKFNNPTNVKTAIHRAGMSEDINMPIDFIRELIKNKILTSNDCR